MNMKIQKSFDILDRALKEINPVAVVCLYSGGYDSMISTHLTHRYFEEYNIDIPLSAWSIDTMMSADGWRGFIRSSAKEAGFRPYIYKNRKGYKQFRELINHHGCPYSRRGHSEAYRRLKERGIDAILQKKKTHRNDFVLFSTGIRREESSARSNADEYARRGKSSAWFCSPIVEWTKRDSLAYRSENNFPNNPFYESVGGSGDCQCNWGNFIDLETLESHSPKLSKRVSLIDKISKENHGWGWDESPNWKRMRQIKAGQTEMFADFRPNDLCAGCARVKPEMTAAEEMALMRDMFG